MSEPVSEQVKRWQTEIEKNEVTWESFSQANAVFGGDYSIVRHPDTPVRGIFDVPNDQGMYSLSNVESLNEEEFLQRTEGKEVVVLVMCMDARAQRQTYEEIKKKHPESVLLVLSMGGGIVQQDNIVRAGSKVDVYRSQALATELHYIQSHVQNVEAVYVTGHDCQCGACKFFNDDVAVHEVLGVEKGSTQETDEMAKRIQAGATELMPKEWQLAGKVKQYVVHIDPNTNVFADMKEV